MSHNEHGEHKYRSKATALWLIVTVLIITIAVPLLILGLTLPKLP